MDRKRLRLALIERDKRLVDLHRSTGIPYNRLVRLANGYYEPSDAEVALIASALGVRPEDLLLPAEQVGSR